MTRVGTDVAPVVPAAYAFGVRGGLHHDPYPAAAGVGGRHSTRRGHRRLMHVGVRGDEEEAQLVAQGCEARKLLGPAVDVHLRIKRRADAALLAQLLEL